MSNDGGPAFPVQESVVSNGDAVPAASGMSLRDYFAANAVSGVIESQGGYLNLGSPVMIAQRCYEIADAMLAARKDGK